jgi:hypothetical protein
MWLTPPYREGMTSIADIAIAIEREGFEALDVRSIDTVLELASIAHASPVLAEVFADANEPAPVRERAFGRLAMQISAAADATTTSRPIFRRLHPRNSGSKDTAKCSGSKARPRRSRVTAPASSGEFPESGGGLRSYWPTGLPSLR